MVIRSVLYRVQIPVVYTSCRYYQDLRRLIVALAYLRYHVQLCCHVNASVDMHMELTKFRGVPVVLTEAEDFSYYLPHRCEGNTVPLECGHILPE